MTTSVTPLPVKSLPPPNSECHIFEPRNTAPTRTTISRASANPLVKRRLRLPRASRIRSDRLIRRRGGPTATGSARSRPPHGLSVIPDLSVRGQSRAPLVQPILQNPYRRSLIDHRSLFLGADTGVA